MTKLSERRQLRESRVRPWLSGSILSPRTAVSSDSGNAVVKTAPMAEEPRTAANSDSGNAVVKSAPMVEAQTAASSSDTTTAKAAPVVCPDAALGSHTPQADMPAFADLSLEARAVETSVSCLPAARMCWVKPLVPKSVSRIPVVSSAGFGTVVRSKTAVEIAKDGSMAKRPEAFKRRCVRVGADRSEATASVGLEGSVGSVGKKKQVMFVEGPHPTLHYKSYDDPNGFSTCEHLDCSGDYQCQYDRQFRYSDQRFCDWIDEQATRTHDYWAGGEHLRHIHRFREMPDGLVVHDWQPRFKRRLYPKNTRAQKQIEREEEEQARKVYWQNFWDEAAMF